jgi:predicted membrane protein
LSPVRELKRRNRSQRGEGRLKAIIVTAILVAGIAAAWKLVPPYSAEYQLADKIQEIARFAVVERTTEEQIREKVFKTIQDLEIPAKREDIKVTAGSQKVTILVDYTVPVDILGFYHIDLHFTPSSENKSLT